MTKQSIQYYVIENDTCSKDQIRKMYKKCILPNETFDM